MPLSRIEVCRSRSPEDVRFLLESVYEAQIEAFGVPATDRQIRYFELRPEHFLTPPGRSENFTLVTIQLFPGRTVEAKRKLFKSIVERFAKIGISPLDVFIGLQESARENWSLANGDPVP
jgi:phenylpyruvate tautomerase PptA (4-oxalocrotonate tautomerase family)